MGSIVARIQAQPNRGTTSGVIPAEYPFPPEDPCVGFHGFRFYREFALIWQSFNSYSNPSRFPVFL
jgi:hypothetical protein